MLVAGTPLAYQFIFQEQTENKTELVRLIGSHLSLQILLSSMKQAVKWQVVLCDKFLK